MECPSAVLLEREESRYCASRMDVLSSSNGRSLPNPSLQPTVTIALVDREEPETIRIISARKADRSERHEHDDFRNA
jgi:uncharacterized DUF497 family protein